MMSLTVQSPSISRTARLYSFHKASHRIGRPSTASGMANRSSWSASRATSLNGEEWCGFGLRMKGHILKSAAEPLRQLISNSPVNCIIAIRLRSNNFPVLGTAFNCPTAEDLGKISRPAWVEFDSMNISFLNPVEMSILAKSAARPMESHPLTISIISSSDKRKKAKCHAQTQPGGSRTLPWRNLRPS